MSDDIKTVLYGKSAKVKLADGNEYTLREPSIDDLENLDFELANINELKNIKKLAWLLLKKDNLGLEEKSFGKLITFSMMTEGSDFMKGLTSVIAREEAGRKN